MLEVRRGLGYVTQDGGLFPHLTARDNVILMARYLGWDRSRIDDRLAELAELTRFPADGLDRFPAQLSGGQRQRVSLMRALMLDPKVILLDEPMGALDPMVRAELQADLRAIFRSLEKTVVMVTHDLAEAGWFGDEILLMRDGRIVQRGTLAELVDRPGRAVRHPVRQRPAPGPRARRGGRLVMPGLAILVALALVADESPADGPGRIEDVHRVGDPGRDRPGPDSGRRAYPRIHRRELGGTQVLFHALEADELDVYPEYTGTISGEILAGKKIRDEAALRAALAERGVGMSRPLGFNDTYAIGMREEVAAQLGIVRLSDLRRHPD